MEIAPAPPLLIGHNGHVIGKDGPKAEVALIRLRLAHGGTRHGDRLVHKTPRLAKNGTVSGSRTVRTSTQPAVHGGYLHHTALEEDADPTVHLRREQRDVVRSAQSCRFH